VLEYNKNTEFVGEFLTKVDCTTMYYAIEARSPFLDHVLWEFASSLDYSARLQGKRLKSILREIVTRRIGPEVAARPKQGFHIPIEKWLVTRWRRTLETLVDSGPLTEQGWIRKETLKPLVDSAIQKGKANIHLWRLVLFNKWLARQPL
jgi:asparagine synthase (glutamine-hydrolysing)